MNETSLTLIIALSSFSSIVLLCGCIRFYRDIYRARHKKDRLYNIRKKIVSSKRIKPISLTMLDEEIKSKSESEIRIAEENV